MIAPAALSALLLSAAAPALVAGWAPPTYAGLKLVWSENFPGASGTKPNANNWHTITEIDVNNELQRYTTDVRNMQISGGDTLQIVPWKNYETGEWTSGRIEGKYTFTPQAGAITVGEARIRFGDFPAKNKQGIWPAFWMLGDSIRHGTAWPRCGELDILEHLNGQLTGYGTVHCDTYPGGACNEPNGRGQSTPMTNGYGWTNWRIQWDRRPTNWRDQAITWYRDGQLFHTVTGAQINSEGIWKTLAASPYYFILNLAVGGNWPGNPNADTWEGYGSMMEVAYVAHYVQA